MYNSIKDSYESWLNCARVKKDTTNVCVLPTVDYPSLKVCWLLMDGKFADQHNIDGG